jgi:solute:Na+ symporter, SSS family
LWGFCTYAFHNFVLYKPDMIYPGQTYYEHIGLPWLHYIDVMVLVLITSVMVALAVNRLVFGNRAQFIWARA